MIESIAAGGVLSPLHISESGSPKSQAPVSSTGLHALACWNSSWVLMLRSDPRGMLQQDERTAAVEVPLTCMLCVLWILKVQ